MKSIQRTKKYGKYPSIGITIAIVMMLILSGPVSAVTVGISNLDGTTHTNGDSVTFRVSAKINEPDYYVPIENYSLAITGATSKGIVFSPDGNVLSGDSGITVTAVASPSANQYGYGYGYGYSDDEYWFGFGYGYGYDNGTGGTEVEYLYDITIDTSILNNGAHQATLSLNTGNSVKPSFESSSASFTIAAASSSSSSGSVGGGTGSSLEPYSNIAAKNVVRMYIQKDVKTEYVFKNSDNPVGSVEFTPNVNAGYISVCVEVLNDVSKIIDSAPHGKVYKNLNIWVGSGGWATSNTVSNPVITFSVEKSWINENNIDPATVKLLRYTTAWAELTTTKTGEDAERIYYSAVTPGFSPFAISAVTTEGEDVTTTVSSGTTPPELVFDEGVVTPTEKTISAQAEKDEDSGGIPGFEGIFAVVGLLAVAAFAKMHKRRD